MEIVLEVAKTIWLVSIGIVLGVVPAVGLLAAISFVWDKFDDWRYR